MTRDRSPEAKAWAYLYKTKRWQHLRAQALTRDLYKCQHKGCGIPLRRGKDRPDSAVVHHIKAHKGDLDLFHDLDNLQSVCKRHHDRDLQSSEALGYDNAIGLDGWPIDPKHPMIK